MNARAYFTILRPWRTLVVAPMYSGFVYLWLRTLFHAPAPEALLFTLAFFGPVVLGGLLLGPLHEVMHRSTFPLLPDARRQFRRWHLRSLAVVSALYFIAAVGFVKTVPGAASCGLIVAGLTLPLLNNRRRLWGPTRPQIPLFILFGILLMALGRELIVSACITAPWAVLAGGLGFAALGFRSGFSSRNTRDRWRDPIHYCFQSTLPFVGTEVILHAQEQNRQFAQENSRQRGADWTSTNIGANWHDWVRVLHHARFGRYGRSRHLIRLGLAGAVLTPIFAGSCYGMTKIAGQALTLSELCRQLVETGKVSASPKDSLLGMVFILTPLFVFGVSLLVAMMAAAPASAFPITRKRLADALFLDACLLATCVYGGNLLGTTLSFFMASVVAGIPLEAGMLVKPLAAVAILPPAIVLSLGITFLRGSILRYLTGIVVVLGTMVGVIAVNLKFGPLVFTPLGLSACIAATGLAAWLSRLALRSHYQTCDLNRAGDGLRKLGLGIA